jgi:hypothetical protein
LFGTNTTKYECVQVQVDAIARQDRVRPLPRRMCCSHLNQSGPRVWQLDAMVRTCPVSVAEEVQRLGHEQVVVLEDAAVA